jgi:hypothetical protein
MGAGKIEHRQTFPVSSGTTAANIKTWLDSVPGTAVVSVNTSKGDWHYSDTHSLVATWTTSVNGGGW